MNGKLAEVLELVVLELASEGWMVFRKVRLAEPRSRRGEEAAEGGRGSPT